MLTRLLINNYALIKRLDIGFDKGFSVITGETGAGKSIIIGALGLLSGQRADTKVIQDDSEKCVIEASFDVSRYDLKPFFDSFDLDYYEDECILRREIFRTGKSRAFINDVPVQLGVMRDISSRLFDIHSQHQNLLINDPSFLIDFVDSVAGNDSLLHDYKARYDSYLKAKREYDNFVNDASADNKEEDYLRFQLTQISDAKLQEDEQENLENEMQLLSNSEDIKTGLYSISQIFDSDEGGVLSSVKRQESLASSLKRIYQPVDVISQRIESVYLELKDIAYEVSGMAEDIVFDQERLEQVKERLDLIYSLQQKFHVSTISDLLKIRDDLAERLSLIEHYEEHKAALAASVDGARSAADEAAGKLSEARASVFDKIEADIEMLLHELGMPNARLELKAEVKPDLTASGRDELVMLFSANKNRGMLNVAEVASGGELARLMLAIKSLICRVKVLPTIIFDEIDTGVSGEIAARMGDMMDEMGQRMQVISITHLPQIAAKGRKQYKVYKQEDNGVTVTNICLLTEEQRVNELAVMLSGNKVTSAAIDNAKELLRNDR